MKAKLTATAALMMAGALVLRLRRNHKQRHYQPVAATPPRRAWTGAAPSLTSRARTTATWSAR